MKRMAVVLLMLGCVSAALWAQAPFSLSAGAGGNFTYDFTSYFFNQDGTDAGYKPENYNYHMAGGGMFAFFDATYVEANIGILFGNYNSDKKVDGYKGRDTTAIKLGLFGKFPVEMGGFAMFPMLGIDGQLNVSVKYDGQEYTGSVKDEMNKRFSSFWIKGGIGFDIPVADRIFVRPEALYGIRLNTESESKLIKDGENIPKVSDGGDLIDDYKKYYSAIVGHGLDLRISIGFRF